MFLAVLDIPSDRDGIQVEMTNEGETMEETRRHSKVGLMRLEMRRDGMLLRIKNSTHPCFQTLMHRVRIETEFPSREKALLVRTFM